MRGVMRKLPLPAGGTRKGGLCYCPLLGQRESPSSVGMCEPVGGHTASHTYWGHSLGCPPGPAYRPHHTPPGVHM